MRELHKWKDRVELRLDNRQIFFLFFGMSVVGCFVFALGVMVGKRMDMGPQGPLAAAEDDPLADLDELGTSTEPLPMTFKEGLAASALPALPKTRTPEEVAAAGKKEEEAEGTAPTPPAEAPEATAASATHPSAKPAAKPAPAKPATAERKFTLQMKAFARKAEAEAFADKLRRRGHDVRIETKEVRGRIWHRVRLGSFDSWDEALAAKAEFERAEHIIAYVVRK
ncbi:MAG: SPOR domain-containing protein [Deltaproteobacteria bacterium]|nr:MAG: SPOR domain-containing protein [Deltaproteobacteria bacterium]